MLMDIDLRRSEILRFFICIFCEAETQSFMNEENATMNDNRSSKYTDIKTIYEECSGPGGLRLAEFIAEKMHIEKGKKLIDIGFNRGYQTCFLAREYDVDIVAIDPLDDIDTGLPHSDYLMKNAADFGVAHKILGVKTGVPESLMPTGYFDYAYSTTTLEMVRGYAGMDMYMASLQEIHRILKKGGIFGLGEPMHFDVPVPQDLAAHVRHNKWEECFATIEETKQAVLEAGFTVLEADYCEDADEWWSEFAAYEPFCDPDDIAVIRNNDKRWLSFGYVIAAK